MTISHWLRPHKFTSSDLSADVVIVGAGYVGLSTAYWISMLRPDLKLIVVDRGTLGAGASGRNAGFLTKGSATFYKSLSRKWGPERALQIFQYAEQSLELVHQHILKSSPEIKYEKTSSLTLFQTPELRQSWEDPQFDPRTFKFDWREESALPASLRGKFFGAFENQLEYKINPTQLLSSLRTSLEARKIAVIENLSAFEVTEAGIQTETNTIRCKQVVLALNGYLPQFHQSFKDYVTPCRAQMLAVELEDDIDSAALHYDSPERVYWRRSTEKTLLIGGKRLVDEAAEVGDFERISPKIQSSLESYLRDMLKVRFKVIHRWSGIMGFTEHELPILTKISAPTESFVIGGFSGHGMGLGFRAAQEMAELVTGVKDRSFFDGFKSVKINL